MGQTSSSITAIFVCSFNDYCYMNRVVFSFESALFAFQANYAGFGIKKTEFDLDERLSTFARLNTK